MKQPLRSFDVKSDVITLKIKPRRSSSHPEDSRRLEIVQNFAEDNVNKTTAFEDCKLEYYTKGNVVDYAYVTIAAVYMLGGVP